MTIVTAAIIINNNKVMIARRGKNQKLAGKWEFPGGKLKPGESMEDCLIRELKEELNLTVEISGYFGESIYQYGQELIKLVVYYVNWKDGEPVLNFHDKVKWVDKDELSEYDFSPADIPFVKILSG
ncbi:MAG: 8-oxo-dGTP diphosphatase MutT [Tindallia sp. MSAO_Bac2]|nr:MAG: 8-oxo-dGTP diphosphatase MutT [Tindallia sp. MSAO_Bac2]